MTDIFLNQNDIDTWESGQKFDNIECQFSIEEDRKQRAIEREREKALQYNIRLKEGKIKPKDDNQSLLDI